MKGGIWLKRGLMMQNYCPRKDILIKIVVFVDSLMMVKSDQREDIEHNSIKMTRKNTAHNILWASELSNIQIKFSDVQR